MSFIQVLQIVIIIALIYAIFNINDVKAYAQKYSGITFNSIKCNPEKIKKQSNAKKTKKVTVNINELEHFLNSQIENIQNEKSI